MKLLKLFSPLFSAGALIYAIILFGLNFLAFKFIDGFSSWYLVFVIEVMGIVAYVISRMIQGKDENVWFEEKKES